MKRLFVAMSTLLLLGQSAQALSVVCLAWQTNPIYWQAKVALEAAKTKGVVTSLKDCQMQAKDGAAFARLIDIPPVISGTLGGCLCDAVFSGGPQDNIWELVQGEANDIGANGGNLVVVGTTVGAFGFGIFKRNGGQWEKLPGEAVAVAVDDSGGRAEWVVNNQDQIFRRSGNQFIPIPGNAKDIAFGGGSAWVIGTNQGQGGFGIYKFDGRNFQQVAGAAVRIAVEPNGTAWVVTDIGAIFKRENNRWTPIGGQLRT